MKDYTENIEEMVRDFCSVAPKSKSEVRRRISESIAQAIAEERERVVGECCIACKEMLSLKNEYK